jgi:glucose/arabinose dehydrogenase
MLRRLLVPAVTVVVATASAVAQSVPTGFTIDTLVSSGLAAPHDFCFLPDGRILIGNRAGSVQVYAGGAAVTVGTVPSVEVGSERGLLSITADPSFSLNGHIYVWYSSGSDSFMHLDRFTCTGDLAIPTSTNLTFASTSRRVILASVPDSQFNHNGGSCRFGPDGMLYQSIGDDAVACNAQSLTSQVGCILRMNVSTLPAGGGTTAPTFSSLDPGNNPLSANTDFSQLVIAHGLRNPVRMEIDQVTGNLYIGDVGQNAVEEYDEYVYPAGGTFTLVNYGWPWREGNNSFSSCSGGMPAVTAPIAAVPQGGSWLSVMGAPRYRNQNGTADFGPAYEGNAFYLDYFAGQLRRLVNNAGVWSAAPAVPGQPNATNWGTGFVGVASMRQGPDGALYYTLGPTNSIVAVSGGGQIGPALEPFPQPIVARVLDTQSNPLPFGTVNFAVSGPATLSTTNPVIADANGYAQTTATAINGGGTITVTASTPNSQTNGTFGLYARNIGVSGTATLVVVSITNQTAALPAQVPYIVMVAIQGAPSWLSPVGPICTDPSHFATFIIEDGTGIFGGISLSGTGGIGAPNLTKVYNIAPGLLTGLPLEFAAIGFDPITGLFRTDCEQRQY